MPSQPTSDLPEIRRPLPTGIVAAWDQVDPRVINVIREAIRDSRWPLMLYGPPGTGKSCASALIYASWPRSTVKWFLAPEIVRLIQTARIDGCVRLPGSEQVVGEQQIWSVRIDQPDLLVLDDVGTRKPTDSQYEILFEIIDRRKNRPLVVSTNHSPDTLAEVFDARIVSRLTAGTRLLLDLEDRRQSDSRAYRISNRVRIADPEARAS